MKLIDPVAVDDAVLVSSNVTEDDYSEWDVGTTYAAEDRAIVIGSTHKIYESTTNSNTGNDPTTDTDGTNWIEVSATNKWKSFDSKLSDSTTKNGEITYELLTPSNVTAICIFNPVGANLNITVTNPIGLEVYNKDINVIDAEVVATDWLEYLTLDLTGSFKSVILETIPAYGGFTIDLTLTSSGPSSPASLGEVVIGYARSLGETNYGTTLSILDFSTKEADTFGNFEIIERSFQDEVNFQFQLETANAGRVKKMLSDRRASPTVYFSDFGQEEYGAIAYGYYEDFEIPLGGPSISYATLNIRGLA